jgi:hypothetical protein
MKKLLSSVTAVFMTVSALLSPTALTVNAEENSETAELKQEYRIQDETREDSGLPSAVLKTITQEDLAYFRAELVKRNREIILNVPYDDSLYDTDLRKELIEGLAMAHTGQPREGDYLLYQIKGCTYSIFTKDGISRLEFTFNYYTDAEKEKQVDEAVNTLLKQLNVYDAPDYVKIETVYRWMTDNITYDHNQYGPDEFQPYSAYGAIVKRTAVCQGYAVLFYRLMLELGVDCRVMNGIAGPDFHAWNIVRLNDRYYYIDATFGSSAIHPEDYFLKGTGNENFVNHHGFDRFNTAEFTSQYPMDPDDYKTEESGDQYLFADVRDPKAYYFTPVYWAAEQGITNGYTDSETGIKTFKPQNKCTREAVVTFLWRLAGKPEPKSRKSSFTDVQDKRKYYYKAVLWASDMGITKGYSDGSFRPDDTCLREHVVTFLWRYAKQPSPKTSKNPFNDVKSSDYYYKAVLWANEKGIAKGYSSGAHAGGFGPKLDCLREHVVTFLYRYAE